MKDEAIRIQIFGQRCSGTTYLEKLIIKNFQQVKIINYYGFKHVFNAQLQKPILPTDRRKIIIIVREPYDWIRSVHREPHHCADLLGLPFADFIRAPWKAYPSKDWNNYDRKTRFDTIKEEKLIESFENVIACRNAKMKLFKELNENHSSVMFITYESLRDNTELTLDRIKEGFGLTYKSLFQQVYAYKDSGNKFKPKNYIRIRKRDLQFINDRVDWNLEDYFGYKPKELISGSMINYHRMKFLAKQWYYENIGNK